MGGAKAARGGGARVSGAAPAVSVVIPTRNRAATLERAVRGVLAQTMGDLEVVVVDDASTDGTPALLARLAEADPRVRVERMPEAGGAARARNHGIRVARAEWVAFQDDDDEWLPAKLERQVAAARGRPEVGLVYCPYRIREADGREMVIGGYDPSRPPGARRMIFRRNFLGTPAVLARRSVLLEAGGFDPALPQVEDWDLWIRVAQRTEMAWVSEPLVLVHVTPGSLSSSAEKLRVAAEILLAKLETMEGARRADRANATYLLGHEMVRRGLRGEGVRLLVRALVLKPWPPQRLGMLAAACLGPRAHRAALGVLWYLAGRPWRRRAAMAPATDSRG